MTAAIPYGAYWSSPFARWQGAFADLHSLRFAAHTARAALAERAIDPAQFDFGVLGTTVPQQGSFYGLPWVMGEIGAPAVAGPTIAQACATGVRILACAADEVTRGDATVVLALAADRVSNGPQIYHPAPRGPGGSGRHEAWVLDNFDRDPFTGESMLRTAENVAAAHGISTAEQNEATLCRYEQYGAALADGRAFQRRFMALPFAVPDVHMSKAVARIDGDEGIHTTTAEGLAALRPVLPGGTVTHGGQTHPADGNAGIVVTTPDRARDLAADSAISIRLVAFGQARVRPAYMPEAPVPAARRALSAAGVSVAQLKAVKTHNPFIVTDIVLSRALGLDPTRINNYGCSLVWGHPQAPTGLRSVIELIEELVAQGGGYGLFTGCAAGDTAMAVLLSVGDAA